MAQQTFRSAFNGFNREDVVHYIEYLNAQHAAEITQLRSELDFLRGNAPQDTPAVNESASGELIEQQAARIRELFDQCKAQEETIVQLTAQLNAAQTETHGTALNKSAANEELEAYRRAERIEREARERAELVYFQANGVLADATSKVDSISSDITDMADQVMRQLTQLQMAVSSSKQALQDASSIMNTIRPNK